MAQLAKQRSLIPVAQRVIAAVGKPHSIANEDVVVDVALSPAPKDCTAMRMPGPAFSPSSLRLR